jgi:hypothetical protein
MGQRTILGKIVWIRYRYGIEYLIETVTGVKFYKSNHNWIFNGYKTDGEPLEIGEKVKTSAGRKGVIVDYYTNIEVSKA